ALRHARPSIAQLILIPVVADTTALVRTTASFCFRPGLSRAVSVPVNWTARAGAVPTQGDRLVTPLPATPGLSSSVQAQFLRLILPRVKTHGRVFFRHVKCRHRKAEAIAEMIALSWTWFICLVQKGKDPARFPTAIASY